MHIDILDRTKGLSKIVFQVCSTCGILPAAYGQCTCNWQPTTQLGQQVDANC